MNQRRWTSVAVAYLILLLSFAAGLWALERRDIARTDEVAVRSCQRVNALRQAINSNALVLAVSVESAAARERKLAQTGPQKATHRQSLIALQIIKGFYVYRPLTDCHRAVFDLNGYQPPKSRPFTRKQLDSVPIPR